MALQTASVIRTVETACDSQSATHALFQRSPDGDRNGTRSMGWKHLTCAYLILLVSCVAGALHLSWWWACACSCSLSLLSLLTHRRASMPHFRDISDPILVASSVINGIAAAAGAFLFGIAARWFWAI